MPRHQISARLSIGTHVGRELHERSLVGCNVHAGDAARIYAHDADVGVEDHAHAGDQEKHMVGIQPAWRQIGLRPVARVFSCALRWPIGTARSSRSSSVCVTCAARTSFGTSTMNYSVCAATARRVCEQKVFCNRQADWTQHASNRIKP